MHSQFPAGKIDFDTEKGRLDESMAPLEGKSVKGIKESAMVQRQLSSAGPCPEVIFRDAKLLFIRSFT